jgi:major histocompatibility complex class I
MLANCLLNFYIYIYTYIYRPELLSALVRKASFFNGQKSQGKDALLVKVLRKTEMKPGVVAHAFNPSTQEAEAGGFLSSRPAWSTE